MTHVLITEIGATGILADATSVGGSCEPVEVQSGDSGLPISPEIVQDGKPNYQYRYWSLIADPLLAMDLLALSAQRGNSSSGNGSITFTQVRQFQT